MRCSTWTALISCAALLVAVCLVIRATAPRALEGFDASGLDAEVQKSICGFYEGYGDGMTALSGAFTEALILKHLLGGDVAKRDAALSVRAEMKRLASDNSGAAFETLMTYLNEHKDTDSEAASALAAIGFTMKVATLVPEGCKE